jgi:tryptophan-rich sensory protein
VWSVLYLIIAVSFGYVGYLFATGAVAFSVLLPFILNLAANILYTPLQFKVRNYLLASVDIVVVWGTIVEFMVLVYPYAPWVAYVNIPYLVWVSFATGLQFTVAWMNRGDSKLV